MTDQAQRESFESTDDQRVDNSPLRHQYRVLSEQDKADVTMMKDAGLVFYKALDHLPDGREKSIARTKIEEAVMWAVKGITK
jgi:type 1 glutamine amidotransferase